MKKIYFSIFAVLFFCTVLPEYAAAQRIGCESFTATFKAYESRCTATGSIKVNATGGSGMYKYKVTGQININFTSADSITGLSAGVYTLTVNDINTNCSITIPNIIVSGTYQDPRFTLNTLDVSCDNGNNGKITLNDQSFGRAPFRYSIVAPSPMGVGTTNSTGTFNNLIAGVYSIRMMDSCGGIQTRLVTINNYTWKIDSVKFKKISCDTASGYIRVSDSKGNISTIGGIPGLTYGVVRTAGDTIWSTNPNFTFYLAGHSNFELIVRDACGKIKKAPVSVNFTPAVAASVNTSSFTCSSFSASVSGVVNFFNPQFCLYDSSGAEIACNATGIFTNLSYGSYCIKAHDSCSDTSIVRCFRKTSPTINVGNAVILSNKTCASFSAAITGQIGLTAPNYCLFDSAQTLIRCNTTGIFNNLPYGNYCITVRDGCRDTTLQRCFTGRKPVPLVPSVFVPNYLGCSYFSIAAFGDSLTNPRFCIADSSGAIVTCNYSGIFDSLRYGNYCITIHDSCYDTTITRCISVLGPQVFNDLRVNLSNKLCLNFTATVTSNNLIGPNYCLYTGAAVLVACNNTGVFNNLPYGTYCAKVHNSCPDTTFTSCFTVLAPRPAMDANVSISNRTCGTFSIKTTGEQNFTSPRYCLYKNNNVLLSCNSTGVFSNIAYGNYCLQIKDGCYDTVINRCFSAAPTPVRVNVNSRKSCSYGFARLTISVTGGILPVDIRVMSPNGLLFFNGSYNTSSITIDSVPGTLTGEVFKIYVSDNCGNTDSIKTATLASVISHIPVVLPKCPSSTWLNGSGTIRISASSNTGSLTVRIIKKNGLTYSPFVPPSVVSGNVFTFNNLGPATYIIRYKASDACNRYFYDTVTIKPYQYPNLDRSTAYQCDINGFSIGAVVANGVGPFTYEIIGSSPSSPAVITPPQASPLFNINNGTTYSLVRLRALDACGNASLEDASILPLANNGIISTFNCFQIYTTLSVDTLYNSSYDWYLKHSADGTDSTFIGSGFSIYLPNVTPSDTGLYVCHLAVNNGCIKRTYYYRLDGACSHYLPVTLEGFTGRYAGNKVLLSWQMAADGQVNKFLIERKNSNNSFVQIGSVTAVSNATSAAGYQFLDTLPVAENNYYRLKVVSHNNSFAYSNVVALSKKQGINGISVYPNPVSDVLTIDFNKTGVNHWYKIRLVNLLNQVVRENNYHNSAGSKLQIIRSKDIGAGVYVIKLFDLTTGEEYSQKVVFQ